MGDLPPVGIINIIVRISKITNCLILSFTRLVWSSIARHEDYAATARRINNALHQLVREIAFIGREANDDNWRNIAARRHLIQNRDSLLDAARLLSINIDSSDGLFRGNLVVMIDDQAKLEALIKKLRTVKGVKQVDRI